MKGASASNNTSNSERRSRSTRINDSEDCVKDVANDKLKPTVTIAKKTALRKTARTSTTPQGAKANAQRTNLPKPSAPRRNTANASVTNVLQSTVTEMLTSSVRENNELRKEVKSLRLEVVEFREEVIRRCNEHKAKEEAFRADTDARRHAQFEKMCNLMTDAISVMRQNGLGSDDGSHNGDVSLQQRSDVMKEYVKLCTALQILDPHLGSQVFAASNSDPYRFDDCKAVVEAAKFVLGAGASEDQIEKLLNEELKLTKKDRSTSQRVGSYAAQGQSRAHDNIRNKMIDAFFAHLPSNHTLRIGSSAGKEEKQQCAISLFNSGTFKSDPDYENAWWQAWMAARDEAHSTASTSVQNLTSFSSDVQLPTIPASGDEIRSSSAISIYALGFVVMKISMTLKSIAGIKSRGLRLSHGPAWARETLKFHTTLSLSNSTDESDEDNISTVMRFGKLVVTRLLTAEEVSMLSTLRG